jgi:membrane dipeptidase
LADSATDAPKWHGLSPKGKAFVAEANRLGMVIDASHASDEAFDQMLALSKTPLLLSHSGVRAIYGHPRNLDDDRLRALAARGGVIQVLAFNSYMIDIPKNPERDAAFAALFRDMAAAPPKTAAERQAMVARRRALQARYPTPQASFETFMAHLNHAIQVAGVDHVGIGLDMDGGGGLVGLKDVADDWKITERLLAEGYGEADIQKIWSGNALRVLRAAEAARETPKAADFRPD